MSWNYHLTSYCSNKETSKNSVSITFDDGPNLENTPKVLALLERFNAKATFFCIGKHAEANRELILEIIRQGHTIGNHTNSHARDIGFYSSSKVTSELEKTNKIVFGITGLEMKLFRPAFGITNPKIKRALKVTGHISIGWNKRSYDTTRLSEKAIYNRVTKNLKKGDIILLHDSSSKTIRVLERLLLFLQKYNLQSVPVDQLLEIEPYA